MKKIFIIITFIALFCSSCDDFLTERPEHQWELENALSTYDNAQQAVNGIYGRIVTTEGLNQWLFTTLTTKAGILNISSTNYDFSYTQTTSTSLWSNAYSAINAANFAVNGIPNVADSSFPNPTDKNELVAEARCLRGYLYSLLLLNYCQWYDSGSVYGLVYRDQVSDLANVNTPRITVAESWAKVLEDLDYAIENMSNNFKTPRYVSKLFAKAWKAKLLLIRGCEWNSNEDIAEAKRLVDDCIANLPSGVSMESDMAQFFKNSWDSKENIFVRFLEPGKESSTAGYYSNYAFYVYAYSKLTDGKGEPVPVEEAEMGVLYGHDWMSADPRWPISVGPQRAAETWDESIIYVWQKIYRKGSYAGKQDPVDEKYACYYMRLPELYIMQAELRARTGASLAESIAPINTFRAMRTNPVLEQLPVPASKDELMETIFREYVCELILENGCEFWASMRIMKNGRRLIEEIKPDVPFDITRSQWPIIESEMINNTALAGMQNPGQE